MRVTIIMLKIGFVLMVLGAISATAGYLYFSSNLPKLDDMAAYQPPLATRIYNTDGELIAEYADEHRILTPLEEIPLQLRNAFLAAEDQLFYQHPGINPSRILAAMLANLRAGHTVQGGSTITQQVAKNFLLTPERSYKRKIRELILSHRIEQAFTKDEILYLYLSHIYLGRGSYGVTSAAWRYFGKTLDKLTLGECAMLAGLPKSPGRLAPHLNMEQALHRRNTILQQILTGGFADKEAVEAAMNEPLTIAPLFENKLSNAYANQVYQQLTSRYGTKTLRRQGLSIIVPYSPDLEAAAVKAVRTGLLDVEQRQKYRFPAHHEEEAYPELLAKWAESIPESDATPSKDRIFPALVEKVLPNGDLQLNDGRRQWLLSKPRWQWEDYPEEATEEEKQLRPSKWIAGDEVVLQGTGDGGIRLSQAPSIESALYSIDLKHGTVVARVGGFDFNFGDFDRVDQARRQPGSAFKPLLYATALEQGMTPADIVMDTPIVFDQSTDNFWRPENYKNKFAGPVTLRNALEHSRNLAAIKLLQDVGINRFTDKLRDFPFDRDFPKQLALALGATEAPLEQLTEAYVILASNGQKWKPVSVQQVQDRDGRTLHRSVAGNRCQVCHADPVLSVGEGMRPAEQILEPTTSFLITNMLKGVIDRGTGIRARALGRPAAGKTGTTNDQIDAWFIGYTPQILTGVWTGRDVPTPMGSYETGSHAALPTWLSFMQDAHENTRKEDFVAPAGIEWALIDAKTGKLATANTEKTLLEAFREGSAPTEEPVTPGELPEEVDSGNFFDSGL